MRAVDGHQFELQDLIVAPRQDSNGLKSNKGIQGSWQGLNLLHNHDLLTRAGGKYQQVVSRKMQRSLAKNMCVD